ncbi:helix-turn-helix domain-containing protein [Wansuia hejianensis]|uniref:Helix-turn-helix transcriptional regulator n=1 Tax=Wansuia hejianensis TaxID=2763667 RepID=A0A926EX99_9FIRM|nr:helix-turn-helix transcriptional regulator [Wansuia hejianensis]MBC8590651.1 helix-turn-helix transcriptional regulator [Wansuia hejianensis]
MENELGKRIKYLREEKELSQLEFSKILNISNSTLSQYEAGNRMPGDEIKKKIAEYFNVSLDYLMGASNIKNPYIVDDNIEEFTIGDVDGFIVKDGKYPKVYDVEEAMKIILEQPGLMLKGEILSDESKIILANAIQMGLRTAEELEKKKHKGDGNE